MEDEGPSALQRAVDYVREHSIDQQIEEFICQVVHERPEDPYGIIANKFASRAQPPIIKSIQAIEVLLSTGRPSIQVDIYSNNLGRSRLVGSSVAPLGVSVSSQEPKPHLDTSTRFMGFGSKNACAIVESVGVQLSGKEFTSIDQFDLLVKRALEGKTHIVNVITALSFALAKASAAVFSKPLFIYLYESLFPQQMKDHYTMPIPAVALIEGGQHSSSNLFFESIFLIPKQGISFTEQIRVCTEVVEKLRDTMATINIGKSGGLVTDVVSIASGLTLAERSIIETGFSPGTDFLIGVDCAASFFYDPEKQVYRVEKGVHKSSAELVQYYIDLLTQHPSLTLINDGISDIDHGGWELIRDALMSRVKVYGGDIYSSQSILARRGLKKRWTDGIWLQPGQAGSITDAAETAKLFKQRGKQVAIARRAGETCDTVIADFSVAIQADFFYGGGIFGSEGTAKYNQLLRIYEYLRDKSMLH